MPHGPSARRLGPSAGGRETNASELKVGDKVYFEFGGKRHEGRVEATDGTLIDVRTTRGTVATLYANEPVIGTLPESFHPADIVAWLDS